MSVKQIAGNAALLTISSVVLRIFGIVVIGMTTRMLGVEEFGIFNTHLVAVTILATIAFAGLSPFIVRETSSRGDSKDLSHLRWGLIIVSVLGPVLALAGFAAYRSESLTGPHPSLVLFCLVVVIPLQNFILSLFQGLNRFHKVLWTNTASALLLFGCVGTAYVTKSDPKWFYRAYFAANILGLLVTLAIAAKELRGIFKSPTDSNWKPPTKEELKNYSSLFFSSTLGILHNKIDVLLLNFMMGAMLVGVYSASYRVMEYLLYVPSIVSSALLPVFSADKKNIAGSAKLILRIQSIFMLIAVVLLLTFHEKVFNALYGGGFHANMGYWILFYGVFSFIFTSIYGQVLYSCGGYRPFLKIGGASLAVNLVLNLLLIPRFGADGCAMATAASFMVSALAHTHYVRKILTDEPLYRTFLWGNLWFAAVITACFMKAPSWIVIATYCIIGGVTGMFVLSDMQYCLRIAKSKLMGK
jgi:O-antigen/teichoic acid export membrane protein